MISGAATAPNWVAVLDASKDWGIPPHQIAGGSPLLWYQRWYVRRELEIKISRMNEQDRVLHGAKS